MKRTALSLCTAALLLVGPTASAQDPADAGLKPPTGLKGKRPANASPKPGVPKSRNYGMFRQEPPRNSDRAYAWKLGKSLRRISKPSRRYYPKQKIPDTTLGGHPLHFAAREATVQLDGDLTVRRLRFPNESVARSWAGAQAADHLIPVGGPFKPQIVSLRGRDAVILEGAALKDAKVAKNALQQAWRLDPSSSSRSDLLSYDDGTAQVVQSGPNWVLRGRVGDLFELLDSVLPKAGSPPIRIGYGTAERLAPDTIRSVSASGAVQVLHRSRLKVQIENGKPQDLARARAVYDAIAPSQRRRHGAKPTATTVKAGATKALEKATSK